MSRSNDKYELRLLTRPLYEYGENQNGSENAKAKDAKPSGAEEPTVGAMFAFCQETDPEIFLLIEAQKAGNKRQWMYAAAEFSNLSLFLQLDGQPVWSADPPVFNPAGPHVGGHLTDVNLEAPTETRP